MGGEEEDIEHRDEAEGIEHRGDDEDDGEAREMDRLALQKQKYDGLLARARRIFTFNKGRACHDNAGECSHWQRLGECWRNPEYMLNECKVPCGVCVDHDATPELAAAETQGREPNAMPTASGMPVTKATAAAATASEPSGDETTSPRTESNSQVVQRATVEDAGMEGKPVDLKAQFEERRHGDEADVVPPGTADGTPAVDKGATH